MSASVDSAPAIHRSTWTAPIQLEVIVGSVREGRFGPVVAHWFVRQAKTYPGIRVGVLDLADNPSDFAARIDAAEAVVVVTPEYNHSYPGPLKTAIDALGRQWWAKAIGFVSYGGLSGGLRAVEPLRVVFAELHAVTVRETVSFNLAEARFSGPVDSAEPADPEGPRVAARTMLDQLVWWARALREASARQPYGTRAIG